MENNIPKNVLNAYEQMVININEKYKAFFEAQTGAKNSVGSYCNVDENGTLWCHDALPTEINQAATDEYYLLLNGE